MTFYAYKGGTGRTLTLANAAKYLSQLGQSVLAIDLDLEAPGLHHKMWLGCKSPPAAPKPGVVDYLSDFIQRGAFPDSLEPYVTELPREMDEDGSIRLISAGRVTDPKYWRQLAAINWHNFLFGKDQQGLLFFLELKERIRAELKPDFLLIDARTGITEVGGVATTLLPDRVVCFLTNNPENLEGTRAVLRGIKRASAERPTPIQVLPVLSRLPRVGRRLSQDNEARVLESIHASICSPTPEYPEPLDLPSLHVLHSEESLAYQEELRVGSAHTIDASPLLRDYVRLFSQVVPPEVVTPRLDRLVAKATAEMLDNPERAQGALETLVANCPHQTSYLALIKFYRLRSAPARLLLRTAARYWEFSRDADNPLLRQVIHESFSPERMTPQEDGPLIAEFVESVWMNSPDQDAGLGLKLAGYLFKVSIPGRAVKIVRAILDNPALDPAAVIECVRLLNQGEEFDLVFSVIDQWTPKLADSPDFQAVWVSSVVRKGDPALARALFESKHFRPAIALSKSSTAYSRLLMLAGKREELDAALTRQLDQVLVKDDIDSILQVARLYEEVGRLDTFRSKVRDSLPRARADRILSYLERVATRAGLIPSGEASLFA